MSSPLVRREKCLKVVILGEGGVGKTTLAESFTREDFFGGTTQTIAVEFHTKVFHFEKNQFRLQIWDLGGQPHFRDMGVFRNYCQGADGALICFDLGDLNTLKEIPRWMGFLPKGTPALLVGTKYDTINGKDTHDDFLNPFLRKFGLKGYLKTSAKDNKSVFLPFVQLLRLILQNKGRESKHANLEIYSKISGGI